MCHKPIGRNAAHGVGHFSKSVRQKLMHAYLTAKHGIQARVIIRKCPGRHLCQREGPLSLQTGVPAQVIPKV
jgi:hypothetical protein